jgi:hypothetical protein
MILSCLNSPITKEMISVQKEINLKLGTTEYPEARFIVTMATAKYLYGLLRMLLWEELF